MYLPDYELIFDKVAKDGSGKCGLVPCKSRESIVYGVVFEIDENELPDLDKIEGNGIGYQRGDITVYSLNDKSEINAATYFPIRRNSLSKPYDWYVALVVEGLREHGFSEDYIKFIQSFKSISDPDIQRAETNWALIQNEPQI